MTKAYTTGGAGGLRRSGSSSDSDAAPGSASDSGSAEERGWLVSGWLGLARAWLGWS